MAWELRNRGNFAGNVNQLENAEQMKYSAQNGQNAKNWVGVRVYHWTLNI